MSKAEKLVVNSGLKTYEIEFEDRGVTTQISFNPTDEDLPTRLIEAKDNIDRRMKEININTDDIKLNADGLPDFDEGMKAIEQLKQTTKIICEEIDIAFGNPISAEVFKYCNPLSVVNGNYFFLQFIEGITPLIEKAKKADHKKANSNIQKYLGKYKGYIK